MTTGDGTYEPVLSTVDAEILSIIGDQDSASNNYKTVEDVIICDVSKPTETVSCDVNNTSDNTETSNKASYEKKMKSASLEVKIKLSEYYRLIYKKHKLLDLELKMKQKEYENMIK